MKYNDGLFYTDSVHQNKNQINLLWDTLAFVFLFNLIICTMPLK